MQMLVVFGQIIGVVGTVIVISGYFLAISQRITVEGLTFSLMNLTGASCLLVSLCISFNLGALIIQVFWILISLYGVARYCLRKKSRD